MGIISIFLFLIISSIFFVFSCIIFVVGVGVTSLFVVTSISFAWVEGGIFCTWVVSITIWVVGGINLFVVSSTFCVVEISFLFVVSIFVVSIVVFL